MSLIPARWRRGNGPVADDQATDGAECHRWDSRPSDRLRAPQGVETWLCGIPNLPPTAHDTEQAAKNRAAGHKGAVVWPALVEPMEETG